MRQFLIIGFILLQSFAQAQQPGNRLLPLQMKKDLRIVHDAFVNLHPGIYRFNTPEQFEHNFRTAINSCDHPLSKKEFYLILSKLTATIKCGHTYLNPLNLDSATAKNLLPQKVIPLFFITINKKIFITHNVSNDRSIIKGDQIVFINNYPVSAIIDSLLTVSRSDGNNSIGKKINNINETPDEAMSASLFDIYFPMFFKTLKDEFTIGIRHFNSDKIEYKILKLVHFRERKNEYELRFGKVPVYESTWDYKILNSHTAYMKFGTFAFWNSHFNTSKYIDSIFSDLHIRQGISKLIIDIRGNEGGDNSGQKILSYISKEGLVCDTTGQRLYKFLKIPDSIMPYLSTWDNSFKKPKDSGLYFKNDLGLYERKKPDHFCEDITAGSVLFNGKCILLTDAKNSSAAFQMAQSFQEYKLGKILGQTTGGSRQGINGGEFLFLTLPESRFEIDVPLIFNYHPGQPDLGIVPNVQLLQTQKDIYLGKDTILEEAIRL